MPASPRKRSKAKAAPRNGAKKGGAKTAGKKKTIAAVAALPLVAVPATDETKTATASGKLPTKLEEKAAPPPPAEVQKEQEDVEKPKKAIQPKKGGFNGMLTSINYIGMGKLRMSFIQSLAMMLNAGLPLIDSLHTLKEEIRHKAMKKVVQKLLDSVENGSPLWRAMEDCYFFTPYEIALVRIGEDAGNLARNLEYLAIQQEKDNNLRQKVKMAMIYPSIVMVLMFIIVMGLGIFVLPNLIQVLFSLNVELPFTTRMVIFFTQFMEEYGLIVAPSCLVGFVVLFLLAKFTGFKAVSQWVTFRIPGIGRLAFEATVARFGVILGGLLQAGVPLVEAIASLEAVTPIVAYKKFYGQLLQHINVGDTFSKTFAEVKNSRKLLPISVQQLIVTGERSGALSEVLMKISSIYERKAEDTAAKLPIILEPMLLLFIGALVGTIAFSILVPIYGIVGSVGR